MKKIKLFSRRLIFLLKAHGLTVFSMLLTTFNLYEYIGKQREKDSFKKAIIVHRNYAVLYFILFAFWGFLLLLYFRKTMANFYWWINLLLVAIMSWLSCPIMFLAFISAHLSEWFYGACITIGLMVIHTILALFNKPFYEFTSIFLIKWSIRGMAFSTLGVVVSISWRSSQLDIVISYFSLLFYVVLIIIFGRTLGSLEFYVNEVQSNEWFYIVLIHYNFMTFYALTMLASCKTRYIISSRDFHYHTGT